MKNVIISCIALALVGGMWTGWAASQTAQANDDKVDNLMQGKLQNAKQLLEGLAMQNYDQIEKNAQQLSLLSTETDWQVLQTPEYIKLSGEFREAADSMRKAAKQKNLDGATLAYVGLTLKCVQCHKYVRSVESGDE
jgi:hypothetical protein